eukprot:5950836-Pleurochrysis_carterae.AAC.1
MTSIRTTRPSRLCWILLRAANTSQLAAQNRTTTRPTPIATLTRTASQTDRNRSLPLARGMCKCNLSCRVTLWMR